MDDWNIGMLECWEEDQDATRNGNYLKGLNRLMHSNFGDGAGSLSVHNPGVAYEARIGHDIVTRIVIKKRPLLCTQSFARS